MSNCLQLVDIGGFFLGCSRFLLQCQWGKTMARRTVTRADLSEAIFQEIGLSRDESGKLVASVFDKIAESKRAGWVNRLFLSSSAQLLETPRGILQQRYQWGLKRFWKSEEGHGARGDVVAS